MPYGIPQSTWDQLPLSDRQAIAAGSSRSPNDDGGGAFPDSSYGGVGAAVPGSWPINIPPPDPYLLDLGFNTPAGQQQALSEIFNAGYSYDEFINQFFGATPLPAQGLGGPGTGGFVPDIGKADQGPIPPPSSATFSPMDFSITNSPSWWRAVQPDLWNPVSEYQTLSNMMIPFLSPEDQRVTASNLFQSDADQFSFYNPERLDAVSIPKEITPSIRTEFFTGERANRFLSSLDRLSEITGRKSGEFGPGYKFLRGLADSIRDFHLTSGATQLTETQQEQLLSLLDPQIAQTEGRELSAYGPLARSFVNPFFSADSLTGKVQNKFGQLVTPPNPRYF